MLMAAHLIDHFVFASRRIDESHKWVIFGLCVFMLVGTFWWFRGVAWGIEGPIQEYTGLGWRKVRGFDIVS
jgi:dolichyl-phosphate-mannose-protein mannosyltransferase